MASGLLGKALRPGAESTPAELPRLDDRRFSELAAEQGRRGPLADRQARLVAEDKAAAAAIEEARQGEGPDREARIEALLAGEEAAPAPATDVAALEARRKVIRAELADVETAQERLEGRISRERVKAEQALVSLVADRRDAETAAACSLLAQVLPHWRAARRINDELRAAGVQAPRLPWDPLRALGDPNTASSGLCRALLDAFQAGAVPAEALPHWLTEDGSGLAMKRMLLRTSLAGPGPFGHASLARSFNEGEEHDFPAADVDRLVERGLAEWVRAAPEAIRAPPPPKTNGHTPPPPPPAPHRGPARELKFTFRSASLGALAAEKGASAAPGAGR